MCQNLTGMTYLQLLLHNLISVLDAKKTSFAVHWYNRADQILSFEHQILILFLNLWTLKSCTYYLTSNPDLKLNILIKINATLSINSLIYKLIEPYWTLQLTRKLPFSLLERGPFRQWAVTMESKAYYTMVRIRAASKICIKYRKPGKTSKFQPIHSTMQICADFHENEAKKNFFEEKKIKMAD